MKNLLLILIILLSINFKINAQLISSAGGDRHFCTYPDSLNNLVFGGIPSAFGGTEPYVFEWSIVPIELYPGSNIVLMASDILDNTTVANPIILDFTLNDSLRFYLKVTDAVNNVSYDSCLITISSFVKTFMTYEYNILEGDSLFLDKGTNIHSLFNNDSLTFQWIPNEGLSASNLSNNFWAFPDVSIWYSVKITDPFGCEAHGDPFYHVIPHALGIEKKDWSKFILFPNPTRDIIKLDNIDNILIDEIILVDITGKTKKNYKYSGESFINVEDIETGIYFLFFLKDKSKVTEKKIVIE